MPKIESDGAERHRNAIDPAVFLALLQQVPTNLAGVRLHGIKGLFEQLKSGTVPGDLASSQTGEKVFPVRAVYFDKNQSNNWALGWHQDRTIAVKERSDLPGFTKWTMKNNVQHVEPPVGILEKMITIRIHLDDVGEDNAPLLVALGSHNHGRIPEAKYPSVLKKCKVHECLAKAGDIWAYRTSILHASKTAQQPKRRRVLQIDYSANDLPDGLQWAGIS